MSDPSLQEIIVCLGHPIAGNPTQFILERAFGNAGVDARCLTVDVEPAKLASAIVGMRAMGFRGGVIAAPHNEAVCELLDELTPAASFLGLSDSICRGDDGQFVGDHTLGAAVVESISIDLTGKRVVLYGTGTEAEAIGRALVDLELAELKVAGTDASDGESLANRLNDVSDGEVGFDRVSRMVDFEPEADVLIHAATLRPPGDKSEPHAAEPLPLLTRLAKPAFVVDLPFLAPRTELIQAAMAAGHTVVDGVDVLVCRASRAFFRWSGREADRGELREAVEEFFLI